MDRIHRTRRRRDERWYSNWDLLSIAYMSKEQRRLLGASLRCPKTRRWQVEDRIVWLYPLGVRRCGVHPFIGVGVVALLVQPMYWLGQPWQSHALVALKLAQLATIGLCIYFAFIRINPLLAPVRRHRCHFLAANGNSDLRSLAVELDARRQWWTEPKVRFDSDSPLFTLWKFDSTSLRLAAVAAACVLGPIALMVAVGKPFRGMMLIGIACLLIAATLGSFLLGRLSYQRDRTQRALSTRSCPDCGYGLATIPDVIDPALLNGTHTGPSRCPECGTHWPLIPPPVPSR